MAANETASSTDGQSEARRRAQARRDKILARGSDRLAKITSTGRGEEAALWDTTSSADKQRARAAAAPPATSADPDDVDLSMLAPAGLPDNPMQAFMQGNNFSDRFTGTETPPSMDNLFAQMMGGGNAAGGGGPPNPLLAQLMAGAAGGEASQAPAPRPRTWLDRLVPLAHLLTMLGLAMYAVAVMEPATRYAQLGLQRAASEVAGEGDGVRWSAWAALLGERGDRSTGGIWDAALRQGLATVPLLYLFVTAELILQSVHLFLARNQPPTPGLLSTILPYLPPPLPVYASTAMRYWALVGTLLDDFAILVFSIGLLILLAEWRSGA